MRTSLIICASAAILAQETPSSFADASVSSANTTVIDSSINQISNVTSNAVNATGSEFPVFTANSSFPVSVKSSVPTSSSFIGTSTTSGITQVTSSSIPTSSSSIATTTTSSITSSSQVPDDLLTYIQNDKSLPKDCLHKFAVCTFDIRIKNSNDPNYVVWNKYSEPGQKLGHEKVILEYCLFKNFCPEMERFKSLVTPVFEQKAKNYQLKIEAVGINSAPVSGYSVGALLISLIGFFV